MLGVRPKIGLPHPLGKDVLAQEATILSGSPRVSVSGNFPFHEMATTVQTTLGKEAYNEVRPAIKAAENFGGTFMASQPPQA